MGLGSEEARNEGREKQEGEGLLCIWCVHILARVHARARVLARVYVSVSVHMRARMRARVHA